MRALPSVIEPRGSIALSGLQRHLGFVRPGVAPPASSGALGPFGPLGRSLSAPPRPDRRKGSALHALGGFLTTQAEREATARGGRGLSLRRSLACCSVSSTQGQLLQSSYFPGLPRDILKARGSLRAHPGPSSRSASAPRVTRIASLWT